MSLFVLASLLSVLVSQAQGASVQACPASIQQCISEASMKVREQFPDAQLYQVSIFAFLTKNEIAGSEPIDMTLFSAKKLREALEESRSQLFEKLSHLDPARPIVSVTPRKRSHTQAETTLYFDLPTATRLGVTRPV